MAEIDWKARAEASERKVIDCDKACDLASERADRAEVECSALREAWASMSTAHGRAVDECAALRAQNASLHAQAEGLGTMVADARAEVERLRADLVVMAKAYDNASNQRDELSALVERLREVRVEHDFQFQKRLAAESRLAAATELLRDLHRVCNPPAAPAPSYTLGKVLGMPQEFPQPAAHAPIQTSPMRSVAQRSAEPWDQPAAPARIEVDK